MSVFQPARASELKFLDVQTSQAPAVAGTGTLSAGICFVVQGADKINRVGSQVSIKSMEWRQFCQLGTTTGNAAVRTVIVYDKTPNGLAPTIFAGTVNDIFNRDDITAQMNLNQRDRFIVLQDILTPSFGVAGPGADYQKGFRKLGLPQTYNAAAGNIASLNQGNIVAVTWVSPGLAVAAPTVIISTRFRFEDD